jgi:hypothetical protein
MVTPRVTFYETTLEGQQAVGAVTFEDGKPTGSGDDGKALLDLLLDGVDRSDRDAVLEAMRLAPERFDGAYLRAAYEDSLGEGGPGSGHKGHRGIPHHQGGSMASGALMFKPKTAGQYSKPSGGYGSDIDHMVDYASGESKPWIDKLTWTERETAKEYTGASHYSLNKCLRNNFDCKDYHDTMASDLKRALDKGQASEDMVLYRGTSWSGLSGLEPGATFTDEGFASCSANAWKAHGFGKTLLEIEVPEGTKGAWLQDVSSYRSEVEFLLQRGATFAVVGKRTIEMPEETDFGGGKLSRFKEVLRVQVIS